MKPKPIICHLLHGLRVGGAEVLVARLARQLRDHYRFCFVCLDELGTLGEELRGEGYPVEVVGRRPGVDWRCPWRLARLFSRQRVALVHAHQYTPFFYALAARLLYWRPPILFTEHGRWVPDYPRRKRIIANRLLLQRRDRVVGVGDSIRQALIVNEGIPTRRVQVVYNGIDLTRFAEDKVDSIALRREMGVDKEDLVLIQVARLDPVKDHLTALRAVQVLASTLPRVRLVVVGEGSEDSAIRAFAAQQQLDLHVRFLGLRSDVPQLLCAADVFLLTSITEGIPLTLIEAMASRLPVVSTRAGGVGEVVLDGETGLLAPIGDAQALARQVLCLADNPVLRQEMGQQGHARAHRLFSEEQMLASYDRLYWEMLRGR